MKAQDVTVGTVVVFPTGPQPVVKIKVKGAHVVLYPATGTPTPWHGKAPVQTAAAAA